MRGIFYIIALFSLLNADELTEALAKIIIKILGSTLIMKIPKKLQKFKKRMWILKALLIAYFQKL